jgi:hypothetical protein
MKILASFFLISAFLLNGCTSGSNESTTINKPLAAPKKSRDSKTTPVNNFANGSKLKDTIYINNKSAVSFWLDSAEMEKRRKKEGDDFSTGADDAAEYAARADSFLRKHNLPIMQADGSKYLKFLQTNGAFTYIKTDTLPFLHTLYLFEPSKKPYNADITSIEDEYKKFFH